MYPYNHHAHMVALNQHMREMQADAYRNRQARLARGSRPLQRRIGLLLIAAGMALAGPSFELDLAGARSL
jgi:hypothetical protein